MKAIVLVGHGDLPVTLKNSAQLIVGENEDVYAVPLSPQDGKEEYAAKLQALAPKLEKYDSVLVLVDLMGGSPGNGAMETFVKDERFQFVSGVNLAMLLVAMSDDVPIQELIAEGRSGVQNMKAAVNGEADVPEAPKPAAAPAKPKGEGKPAVIENVRIDARGIHGQVATAWIPKLGVNRVIVIDDLAVKDEMQKMALKMAKPNHVKLSVLSTAKAAERLTDPQAYLDEKILVILQRVQTLKDLDDKGYRFPTVNLGNIPNRSGTKSYRKTIHLTEGEKNIILSLIQKGTHFTAQMVPNDPSADFDKLIQE